MHDLERSVVCSLAVASVPSALVGRWSALVSEPHCERERESDFERLVGQNLWRLESLVKQVGDFSPHLEKPICTLMLKNRHVCFKELFLRFFRMSARDWQQSRS